MPKPKDANKYGTLTISGLGCPVLLSARLACFHASVISCARNGLPANSKERIPLMPGDFKGSSQISNRINSITVGIKNAKNNRLRYSVGTDSSGCFIYVSSNHELTSKRFNF